MFVIIYFMISGLIMNGEAQIFNFNSQATSGDWKIINDVVMGGVSKSTFVINSDTTATFSGTLSADNNGGFASARAFLQDKELSDFAGVIIKVKGDGNIYNLRFRTDENYDGVSYQAKFKTEIDNWMELKISFRDFIPTFRGRTISNQPKLESKSIKQIGVMIADKQFGEFKLKIDWINFYK